MPRYDGTGPNGMGPMTGGGSGYCVLPVGTVANDVPAGGFLGFGGGRGRRNRCYPAAMPRGRRAFYGNQYPSFPEVAVKEEKEMLMAEAEAIKHQLEDIQNRISRLEKA